MIKHLYDTFSHWYHGGTIYFYSDPHFGDQEMNNIRGITDDEQIKSINSKVGKCDTLILLGDVGDVNCARRLRGYKVLVMGNHDLGASNYLKQRLLIKGDPNRCPKCNKSVVYIQDERDVAWCSSCGWVAPREDHYMDTGLFDEVYEGALIISEKIILSHEPINIPFALNIHGHVHALSAKNDQLHFNVCAEHINYTPIGIKQIVESGILKNIQTIHRETINKATEKKNKKGKKK